MILISLGSIGYAFDNNDFDRIATKLESTAEFKSKVSQIKLERKKLRKILKNYPVGKKEETSNLGSLIAFEEVLQRLELKSNSQEDCKQAENEITYIDSTSTTTQKSKETQMGLRLLTILCKK